MQSERNSENTVIDTYIFGREMPNGIQSVEANWYRIQILMKKQKLDVEVQFVMVELHRSSDKSRAESFSLCCTVL